MAKSRKGGEPPPIVRSRLVLNFPGFEGTGPIAQLDRLRHSAGKTGQIWGFQSERQSAEMADPRHHAAAECETRGPDWTTATRIVQFSWSDVIDTYEREPFPRGLFRNFPKYIAFFLDGTVGRYYSASKRYWGFTIFPLLAIGLFAIVAWAIVAFAVAPFYAWADHPFVMLLMILALVILMCRWPGKRWYLLLTINDWGFARDMVNRVSPPIELRFREFAETVTEAIDASHHDEIVIAGHSFGTVWAVGALALALEKRPDLLKGRNVLFLALGSSLLKIALAPSAGFMREWTARIMAVPHLVWHEIQTKDDLIAFYKADPMATLGISDPVATLRIDRVKYKDAMDRRRYVNMLRSPYRTHRQYILYQDKRVAFDFVLRLFGPLSGCKLAQQPEMIAMIGSDGGLGATGKNPEGT